MRLSWNHELHEDGCNITTGPRGGKTDHIVRWRVNGEPHPRPKAGDWYVPIKHGLRTHGYLNEHTATMLHTIEECPLYAESPSH